MYLKNMHPDSIHNYSTFRSFTLKNKIEKSSSKEAHPRYETDPRDQLQVDWKEDIKMTSSSGIRYEFNIFLNNPWLFKVTYFIIRKQKQQKHLSDVH